MDCGAKRCAGDGEDKTIINQIMLKFRPIAPRPVSSDGKVAGKLVSEKVNRKRVKRKYVRVKERRSSRLVKDNDCGEWLDGAVEVIGDEVSAGKDLKEIGSEEKKMPCWIDFSQTEMVKDKNESDLLHDSDRMSPAIWPAAKVVVESWITMESVTDTCGDGNRLGCTDDERMRYLDGDTCPGFISNSFDRIEWVNPAYRKMVDRAGVGGAPYSSEFVVSLVVREKFLLQWPAFSCRVRVVNNYCKEKEEAAEKKTIQMIVPCDVWKMDSGGFAWRLDVDAALSLGR